MHAKFQPRQADSTVKPHDLEPRLLEILTTSNCLVGPESDFYYFILKTLHDLECLPHELERPLYKNVFE